MLDDTDIPLGWLIAPGFVNHWLSSRSMLPLLSRLRIISGSDIDEIIKMKRIFTLFTLTLAFAASAVAQEKCGMHQAMQQYFNGNAQAESEFREARQRSLDAFISGGAQNPNRGGGVITIPVVFHVVYNTTAENISDAAIMAQLDRLNTDFSTSYLSTQVAQFLNVAANPNIQFCLADTDPQGNPTTGITRTQTSVTSFAIGHDMKATGTGGVNPWPFSSYYNIWICDIGFNVQTGGTAGYAMLPGWGSGWEAIDGTVLAYQIVGGSETTLSHESGHYLGLNHTWGDLESCANDDGFTDTPNCDGPNFFCDYTATSCGSLDQIENFMDYADCPTMFSAQQVAYMTQILNTNYNSFQGIAGRASLQNSNGCTAAGGNPPVAAFIANPNPAQVNQTVSFTDQSTNSPTQWSWTFGDGGTSTSQNPTHSYSAPGTYPVTLTATNADGSDAVTVNVIVQQQGGGGGTTCDTLVYIDGQFVVTVNPTDAALFEANLYDVDGLTINTALSNLGFTSGWDIVDDGTGNMMLGATSWFDSPAQATNLIGMGPLTIPSGGATLTWKHQMGDNDFRDGYAVILNTTGNTVNDYVGSTLLWGIVDNDPLTDGDTVLTPQSVQIPAQYNGQVVYIGYLHDATDMFLLFLDDIYLEGCTSTPVAVNQVMDNEVRVYPNPSNGQFKVSLGQGRYNTARVMNAMGQVVWQNTTFGNAATIDVDMSGAASGAYILRLDGAEGHSHHKIVLRD